MQEQMGSVSRDENSKKESKKNTRAEQQNKIKNAIDKLYSRLDMTEKRISKLANMSIETFKTEKQREKKVTEKK